MIDINQMYICIHSLSRLMPCCGRAAVKWIFNVIQESMRVFASVCMFSGNVYFFRAFWIFYNVVLLHD